MKGAIVARSLADEHYVTRVNGRVKLHHRRFVDALRAGLQLRNQFTQQEIKCIRSRVKYGGDHA
jgi:hypothetical protein